MITSKAHPLSCSFPFIPKLQLWPLSIPELAVICHLVTSWSAPCPQKRRALTQLVAELCCSKCIPKAGQRDTPHICSNGTAIIGCHLEGPGGQSGSKAVLSYGIWLWFVCPTRWEMVQSYRSGLVFSSVTTYFSNAEGEISVSKGSVFTTGLEFWQPLYGQKRNGHFQHARGNLVKMSDFFFLYFFLLLLWASALQACKRCGEKGKIIPTSIISTVVIAK